MEQNSGPRNEPTYLWTINFQQRRIPNGEKTVSSASRRAGQPHVNQ